MARSQENGIEPADDDAPPDRASPNESQLWTGLTAGLLSRLLGLATQFVVYVLIARSLTTDEFGSVAVTLSVVALLGVFSSQLSQQVARTGEVESVRRLFPFAATIGVSLGTLTLLVLVLLWASLPRPSLMVGYLPVVVLTPVMWLLIGGAAASTGRAVFVAKSGREVLRALLVLPVALVFSLTPIRLAALDSAAVLLFCIVLYLVLRPRLIGPLGKRHESLPSGWSAFARSSVALAVVGASTVALQRLDLIMLGALGGAGSAGKYAVALRLSDVPLALAGAALVGFLPSIASAQPAALKDQYRKGALAGAMITAPILAVLMTSGVDLADIVFGQRYAVNWRLYSLLALSVVAHVGFGPSIYSLISMRRHRVLVVLSVGQIALNVSLNIILIPRFGELGAATATLASYLVVNAASFGYLRRRIGPFQAARWIMPGASVFGACLGVSASVALLSPDSDAWLILNGVLTCIAGLGVAAFVPSTRSLLSSVKSSLSSTR